MLSPKISDEELIARYQAMREIAPNVVIRGYAALTSALLEAVIDSQQADNTADLDRALTVYRARCKVALDTLRKIPEDIWNQWCEVPAAKIIPELEEIYNSYGNYGKKETNQ